MNPRARRLRRQRRKDRHRDPERELVVLKEHQRSESRRAERRAAYRAERNRQRALDRTASPPEPAAPLSGGRLLAAMLSQGIKT